MTAAAAGGALIYACAAALLICYTTDTVIVAYNYRFFSANPPSSKLLFLAELLKLCLATAFCLTERRRAKDYRSVGTNDENHDKEPESWWLGLPMHRHCLAPKQQSGRGWWLAVAEWAKGMLVFAVPAVCYFITNK
jgi:hypothetical protein